MIKRIELENFFSFGERQTLQLNPGVNLLVGINGSGKSNFLRAIHFLGEGMREGGSIQKLMNSWGGFDTVCNYSSQQKDLIRVCFEFDKEKLKQSLDGKGFPFPNNPVYEIEIHRVSNVDYFLKERIYNKSTEEGLRDFVYLEMTNGRGFVSERDETTRRNSLKNYYNEPEEILNGREFIVKRIAEPKRFFPIWTLKQSIETIVSYPFFDTSFTSEIRKYEDTTIDDRLQSDGKNLFSIIQYIARNFSLEFEQLEETVRAINPVFRSIRQDVQSGRLGLMLVEKNLTKTVPISSVSDGTLQFLLLMAIFYNPSRGKIICIDEPEKGLHPDMIRLIATMMRYAAETTQVIVSTHNPLLLNQFELDDLWMFEKDEQNQTVVVSKTEEEIEKWVDNFLPGDLWLRGLIGARVRA